MYSNIKKLNVLLILIHLATFNLYSQRKSLNFQNFTIEDGLASVNTILRDKNGFMWFGGTHGLYRYDGLKFKIFTANSKDLFSLSNNNITYLFEDRDGYIWIGTRQGGINKYNPIDESFSNYINSKSNSFFRKNHVTSITEDAQGIIWVGTNGNGIFSLNKKNNLIEHITCKKDNLNTISDNNIFSVMTENDNIWITSNKGILDCYNKTNKLFNHYKYSKKKYLSTRTGQRLCIDHKNNIWIGTEGDGLFKFNNFNKTFQHFEYEKGKPSLSSNIITDLKEGKTNELWITTDGGGLNLLNTETKIFTIYKNNIYNKNSPTNNSYYCLFIDSNDDLWIGMGDGSVDKTIHSPFKIYEFSASNLTNSLSFNVVVSLYIKNNILWIGTGGGGLDKFNMQTETFYNYKNHPKDESSLPTNIVMSVLEDRKGNIWTGNLKKGLSFKQKNTNRFKFIEFDTENAKNLINNLVFDLTEDELGNIWIATYDEGLYYYDLTHKKIKHYTYLENSKNGLKSNSILRLLQDSTNQLWLGTLDSGIQIYNRDKNKFLTLENLGFDKKFEIKNPIRDIFEDAQKNIWIATEGDAVFKLDLKNKKIKHYTTNSGLPSDAVYGIIQDKSNNYWFSTNKGIATLKVKNDKFFTFNTFDGLPTNDFESGAIAISSDGKLYFGSKKGLVSFYPDQLDFPSTPINLLVTNFRIFNNTVDVNKPIDNHILLNKSITYTKDIELPYFLNNFSFEFATPGYQAPHNINYKYKLEGLDERWITVPTNQHAASFSNISPGTYIFKVKAIKENNFNTTISAEKNITLHITPVWWQTNFAYFFYSFISISLIYFIYSGIKNRIRLKNELLIEKYKHEKDEEFHQSKINFFTTISHELRTSLTLILTPLEELAKVKNSNNRVNNLIMTMNRNAQRLLNLTNQILDFRKMESNATKLKVSNLVIKDFFDELCIPFFQYANKKNIQFQLTVSNSCEKGWLDANKLEIIVYNILSNAFKFAKNKIDINVDLDENDKHLIIKIKDNGKGIPKADIPKIFELFYQVESKKNTSNIGSGIGLAISKNFVDLHYGKILIKSEVDQYTVFNIKIPITKNFYSNTDITNSETITEIISMDEIEAEVVLDDKNSTYDVFSTKPILLIVEDNFEIRNLLKNYFIDNYNVMVSPNGIDGCEKAFEAIPDIIISDIMMPEMNGLEFCNKLKTDPRTSHIPIILLTARDSNTFQIEGLENGADDYVTKPFHLELLRVRIKNLIESRKVLREFFKKEVLLKPKDIAINNVDEIFMKKIMLYIEDNMTNQKFTVKNLAIEMGMSHSVLYRKLIALTGQNINEFLKSVKLSRATQLIIDSEYSINEISDMTGFANPKYFSTCFKTKYGVTPTQYREKKSTSCMHSN
ncbi:response regulator [Flavobacterium sp. LPB0248]|uniref:hybrid sensor histidine kinase/response regulator transcription factor n=1 Tax=Flavobacterium sp. LPB0248 TaxID=2614441 RepID=UPI0015A536AB|nr:two-component regulator propeller domain-containing protein [Flavobacterium sp. LPB0248]QLC65973.1 response regulator [Flavobacterium sp. LPB0248]